MQIVVCQSMGLVMVQTPEQCSIEWYQGRIGCDILLLIHITQIMHKLCTYAEIMQKLYRNYVYFMQIMQMLCKIMQKLCKNYAKIMQKLCRNYAMIMQIMQKLCRNYAEIMQKLCRNYAK